MTAFYAFLDELPVGISFVDSRLCQIPQNKKRVVIPTKASNRHATATGASPATRNAAKRYARPLTQHPPPPKDPHHHPHTSATEETPPHTFGMVATHTPPHQTQPPPTIRTEPTPIQPNHHQRRHTQNHTQHHLPKRSTPNPHTSTTKRHPTPNHPQHHPNTSEPNPHPTTSEDPTTANPLHLIIYNRAKPTTAHPLTAFICHYCPYNRIYLQISLNLIAFILNKV